MLLWCHVLQQIILHQSMCKTKDGGIVQNLRAPDHVRLIFKFQVRDCVLVCVCGGGGVGICGE